MSILIILVLKIEDWTWSVVNKK